MKYHLVLQFDAETVADYDALIVLENQMQEAVANYGAIDGHDMGSGEANIFILTSDPQKAFRQLIPVLERTIELQSMRAACRAVGDEQFKMLWPENSAKEFKIA